MAVGQVPGARQLFASVANVLTTSLARMDGLLVEWERSEDRRGVFLDCSNRMTRAMCGSLEDGRFDDPVWVAELLDRFALHYFGTVESWEAGGVGTPSPWGAAFDAAASRERSAFQLLLAGANAHINDDPMLTLVELLDPVWADLDPETLASRRRDFDRARAIDRQARRCARRGRLMLLRA